MKKNLLILTLLMSIFNVLAAGEHSFVCGNDIIQIGDNLFSHFNSNLGSIKTFKKFKVSEKDNIIRIKAKYKDWFPEDEESSYYMKETVEVVYDDTAKTLEYSYMEQYDLNLYLGDEGKLKNCKIVYKHLFN